MPSRNPDTTSSGGQEPTPDKGSRKYSDEPTDAPPPVPPGGDQPSDEPAEGAAFPTVTPGDDVSEPVDPATQPTPLAVTDDGRGVILDPELGLEQMVFVPAAELGSHIAAVGDDGREYLADYRPTGGPDGGGEVRWAVSVIETKVPYAERPTRGLLDTDEQIADRRYEAVVRPLDPDDPRSQRGAPDAPDDDPAYPVGTTAWWRAYLTEAEVARLRAADNVESVTYEHRIGPVGSEWAARFTGTDFDGPAWRAREARRAAGAPGGEGA